MKVTNIYKCINIFTYDIFVFVTGWPFGREWRNINRCKWYFSTHTVKETNISVTKINNKSQPGFTNLNTKHL